LEGFPLVGGVPQFAALSDVLFVHGIHRRQLGETGVPTVQVFHICTEMR
jgi:hypothetical protein